MSANPIRSVLRSDQDELQPKTILLVEDSEEDFIAFERMVQKLNIANPIERLDSGDEALEFLFREGKYAHLDALPLPVIVILDLNLPGTDGRDVIRQVKEDDRLRSIPIVVLTTSSNPRDIATCYHYGANAYNLKPMGTQSLQQTVSSIFSYWLDSAVLPTLD